MLLFYISIILFGSVVQWWCPILLYKDSQKYTGQTLDFSINCCLKLFPFSLILACSHLPF